MSISCHILALTWPFKGWFGTVLSYLNLRFLVCKKEAVIHSYLVQHCEVKVAQSCLTLCSQNTGVGCHATLQGIFPTQGSFTG